MSNTEGTEVWGLDAPMRLRKGNARGGDGPAGSFTLSPDGRVLAGAGWNGRGLGLFFKIGRAHV